MQSLVGFVFFVGFPGQVSRVDAATRPIAARVRGLMPWRWWGTVYSLAHESVNLRAATVHLHLTVTVGLSVKWPY